MSGKTSRSRGRRLASHLTPGLGHRGAPQGQRAWGSRRAAWPPSMRSPDLVAFWSPAPSRRKRLCSRRHAGAGKGLRPARCENEKPPTDRGFSAASGAGKGI
jgi:hypothetical protein